MGQKYFLVFSWLKNCQNIHIIRIANTINQRKVTILEMKDKILEEKFLSEANSNMLRQIIKDFDIPVVYTCASVKLIKEMGVEFEYPGYERGCPIGQLFFKVCRAWHSSSW